MKAIANIKTKEGAVYIGKLCRHFVHKIEAVYEGNTGRAHFPGEYATCRQHPKH